MLLCLDGIFEPPMQPIWLLGAKWETRDVLEDAQDATNVHEPWAGFLRWSGIWLPLMGHIFPSNYLPAYSR